MPTDSIHHNFCRNPNGAERPWCYVNGTVEFCEITPCDEAQTLKNTFHQLESDKELELGAGPLASVDDIESGSASTNLLECCPHLIVCGNAEEHSLVTGAYNYNSRGRYYRHQSRNFYFYYDRRFKKWLLSSSMYDSEVHGYLDESVECPALAISSLKMAKFVRGKAQFVDSNVNIGCSKASKSQVYQCGLPEVHPEISTPVGPAGLQGNTRAVVNPSDHYKEFSRIMGGVHVEEAVPGSWPHQVSLQGPKGHFCGGSLISPDYVLTSARCASMINEKGFSAVMGLHDLEDENHQEICVRESVVHPEYDPETNSHDIALVRLSWSANLDSWTNPACVIDGEIPPDILCVATGWGSAKNEALFYPTRLQQYPISFHRPCSTEDTLCSGTGGIGVCTGDVSSPLTCFMGGKWLLAGISTKRGECEDVSVNRNYFTKASFYNDWIQTVMKEGNALAEWNQWSEWSACSRECGVGLKFRKRTCEGRGACEGVGDQSETCMSGRECSSLSHPQCKKGITFHKEEESIGMRRGINSRIVGGWEAEQAEWPWIVMASDRNKGKMGQFCGATIISERWLISAGHCYVTSWSDPNPSKYSFYAGVQKRYGTEDYEQAFGIEEIICHEKYQMATNTIVNDICLLKTDRPIKWTDRVSPICLPEEVGGPDVGEFCKVAGWGDTMGTPGLNQFNLNEVAVPIISYETCQNWYDDEMVRIYEKEHLCAGYEQGTMDACQGDSGGPFVCYEQQENGTRDPYLQGVVSFGVGCADAKNPGVYTR